MTWNRHRGVLACAWLLACSAGGAPEQADGEVTFNSGVPISPNRVEPAPGVSMEAAAGSAAPLPEQPPSTGSAPAGTEPADAVPQDADLEPDDQQQPATDAMPAEPATEPTSSTPGVLTVSFTSKSPGGRYAPRNCGAVWIENSAGVFIKTLERWAGIRAGDLRAWNAASGGWGFSFFGFGSTSPDQVDVVTAATLNTHQSHQSTWNMNDVQGTPVPDGTYAVVVEVADDRNEVARVVFEKGPTPLQLTPPDTAAFAAMRVEYAP